MDLCGNQKTAAKLKTLMDLKNTDSGHAGNQNKLLKKEGLDVFGFWNGSSRFSKYVSFVKCIIFNTCLFQLF